MKPSTTVNVRLQSVMIMTAIGFTALCSWLLLSKHATGAVFVHFLKSQWLSAKRRIVLMIVCPHVFQNIFLRVFKAWPQIEWMLLVINLVFSSSFLTLFGILLALNKDLRRIFLLFLTWLFWYGDLLTLMFCDARMLTQAYSVCRCSRITSPCWRLPFLSHNARLAFFYSHENAGPLIFGLPGTNHNSPRFANNVSVVFWSLCCVFTSQCIALPCNF